MLKRNLIIPIITLIGVLTTTTEAGISAQPSNNLTSPQAPFSSIHKEHITNTVSVTEDFIVTAYCSCKICCGVYGGKGITSTGAKVKAGRTVAIDPSKIPYGAEVIINDNSYIAEDCGGAIKGNRIDVYFNTHQEALNFGKQKISVTYKITN